MAAPVRLIHCPAMLLAAYAAAAAACGTETASSVGPSPVRCTVEVPATPLAVAAAGGTVKFAVSTEPECEWSATTEAGWLTQVSPPSQQGAGEVELQAAPNTGPARSAAVRVESSSFAVVQASGCTFAVEPEAPHASATGGSVTVAVATGQACAWEAASHEDWLTVTDVASGTGAGAVTIAVAANTGPQRRGTLSIATQIVTLTQDSGCSYLLSPPAAFIPSRGGEGAILVSTAPGCPWIAQSLDSWIVILAGADGSGTSEVRYRVDPAPDPTSGVRTGTIVIAGQQFTVTQQRMAVPR